MAVNIQIRNDTSTKWASVNPILAEGELATESDTRKFKIGNGVTRWTDLPYFTQGEKGTTGKGLQFIWSGTQLGVRKEGDVSYTYVDLSGDEAKRVTQESARVTAENIRVVAEGNASSGRVKSEADRVANENTRTSAETTRASNETARISSEQSRVASEGNASSGRVKSEADRVIAENARVGAEISRASTDSTRTLRITRIEDGIDNLAESTKSIIPDVSVSTYARVSSLTDKAREGQMNVKVSGNTLKNEVVNGNFKTINSWTKSAVGDTLTVSNNEAIYVVGQTENGVSRLYQALNHKISNRYFVSTKIKRASAGKVTSVVFGGVKVDTTSIGSTYESFAQIIIPSTSASLSFYFNNLELGETINLKDVICIDMGTDASNPLYNKTQAEMDALVPLYFDGLASVVAGSVKTVGKNLFDVKQYPLTNTRTYNTTGGFDYWANYCAILGYFPVDEMQTYTYSNNVGNSMASLCFYDENKTFMYRSIPQSTFTAPVGCCFIRFSMASDISNVTWIQIETGETKTTYEPYFEGITRPLPSATLRSLPNGVRDYIDGDRLVQNISTQTIATATLINTTNVIGAKSAGSFLLKYADGTISTGLVNGTATTSQAGTIYFELNTPSVTELLPSTLKSTPKGSVIYTNTRREIGTYGVSAIVSNTLAPIKTMNKLEKILSDGTRMPLSVITGITIAGDKLSFTHTGLVVGDNIEWEYEFDSALSTTPLIEYEYKNSPNKFGAITVPTFTNSWVADGIGGYYVNGDETVLVGSVKSGTVNTPMFTLAVGSRPLHTVKAIVNANGALGYLTINTTGTVVLTSGSNVTVNIDNVRFRNDV